MLQKLINKFVYAIIRRFVDKKLSEENIVIIASRINKKINVPFINEQKEQEVFENILTEIVKLIKEELIPKEDEKN